MPHAPLTAADWTALAIFVIAWALYEPFLKTAGRPGGLINTDMTVIRIAWMRNMVARDNRLMDGQLVGHVLNSNSFFASSNLILIAAAASALFNGEQSFKSAAAVVAIHTTPALFELQVGLIVLPLARGVLAFIWSIRQLNYCLAAIGAAPTGQPSETSEAYAAAVGRLLNPALSSFNSGVRSYYFAMAAAAWLFGPWAFMIATAGAVALLYRRQRLSPTSAAISSIRQILERPEVKAASLVPPPHSTTEPL